MLSLNLGLGKPSSIPETASIAYTGELLPTGSLPDATKRYLKNSGKDKTPALVESGQGKFFNGTNQYINTGATPNDTVGTFITRFTYASGAIQKIMAGMNYSNNRCYMGINASGKIGVGFGANTYDTLFSPDVLVPGRSYHVAFKYSGSTYWLFVDSVLKATGTITGLASFVGTSFFIGALNNGGTASNYFNSVIDETYYYDVALTDAQISSLYLYPEKVKSYNGAIVPDIGSEANCKLFLPMCENSGSNVVNVAAARGSDISLNTFNMDNTGLTKTSSTFPSTISGSITTGSVWLTINVNTTAPVSKLYTIELDVIVNSGNTTFDRYYTGSAVLSTYAKILTTGKNYITVSGRNATSLYLYFQQGTTTNITINSATIKEITSYPLTNYTTTMHTSAAKLSYGAQCTAWRLDSLGVLLGMSNGLSFDNNVSVKPISTGYIPLPSEDWAIETIMYYDSSIEKTRGNGVNATGRLQIGIDSIGRGEFLCGNATGQALSTGYHQLAIKFMTTTKTYEAYFDGVLKETLSASAYGIPTVPYSIGGIATSLTAWNNPVRTIQGTNKIHKGTQYAKFEIAKSWKAAQKIIAKLGA